MKLKVWPIRILFVTTSSNRKTIRVILIMLIFACYLSAWFFFGKEYQRFAQEDRMAFIVNEELIIDSQVEAFRDKVTWAGKEAVGILFESKAYNKVTEPIMIAAYHDLTSDKLINTNLVLEQVCPDTIGKVWADWYEACLIHTSLGDNEAKENNSYNKLINFEFRLVKRAAPSQYFLHSLAAGSATNLKENIYEVEVLIYGADEEQLPANIMCTDYDYEDKQPDKIFSFWIKETDLNRFDTLSDANKTLNNLLRYSITFLNDDFNYLSTIAAKGWNSELVDFLYFSAVTITTTGYGDIIPNSREVRNFVMLESLLGVLLPGAFLSVLFIRNRA